MKKTSSRVVLSPSGAAPIQIEAASASPAAPPVPTGPSENDIRAYAYHLYEQSNGAPGHELDHWFEATAFLNAGIPADLAGNPAHRHHGAPIAHAATAPLTPANLTQL